jgi:hypothetical protein
MKATKRLRVNRGVMERLSPFLGVLLGLGLGTTLFAADEGDKDITVKLRDVSVFELGQDELLRGQSGVCTEKPFPDVKAYPKFKSSKPVYGLVMFAGTQGNPNSGRSFYYALDESEGTGKGYDRLYFDANRDLDLRNDPVLKPQAHAPAAASLKYSNIKQQVLFDYLNVDFDFGSAGTRPVEMLPRFTISKYGEEEYFQMNFVRTRACEGEMTIGGTEYRVLLGNTYVVLGPLDNPGSALLLIPKKSGERARWWGSDRLNGIQKAAGRFYTMSTTPTGEQLTAHPYRGELGTFEIGAGGRKLDTLTVSGSLSAKDSAVPVGGGDTAEGWGKPAPRCEIPVGDYTPSYITVQFGRLSIGISDNYHSDGKPRGRAGRPTVYGISIRKDQPFVMDFINKPDVLFASPAKDLRLKAGDELKVKAVLVDPKLDIMIRGLADTTRKQTNDANGKPLGYERNLSLDPTVIITRANGKKVAEGVMPFG